MCILTTQRGLCKPFTELNLILGQNGLKFCSKNLMRIIAPPIGSELSISTGTFLNNYDVRDRKLKLLLIRSTVQKRQKLEENNIVETTKVLVLKLKSLKLAKSWIEFILICAKKATKKRQLLDCIYFKMDDGKSSSESDDYFSDLFKFQPLLFIFLTLFAIATPTVVLV